MLKIVQNINSHKVIPLLIIFALLFKNFLNLTITKSSDRVTSIFSWLVVAIVNFNPEWCFFMSIYGYNLNRLIISVVKLYFFVAFHSMY